MKFAFIMSILTISSQIFAGTSHHPAPNAATHKRTIKCVRYLKLQPSCHREGEGYEECRKFKSPEKIRVYEDLSGSGNTMVASTDNRGTFMFPAVMTVSGSGKLKVEYNGMEIVSKYDDFNYGHSFEGRAYRNGDKIAKYNCSNQ